MAKRRKRKKSPGKAKKPRTQTSQPEQQAENNNDTPEPALLPPLPTRTILAATSALVVLSLLIFLAASVYSRSHRSDAPQAHKVQRGETLTAISLKYYGTIERWREIAAANGISNPSRLRPGTVLNIPLSENAAGSHASVQYGNGFLESRAAGRAVAVYFATFLAVGILALYTARIPERETLPKRAASAAVAAAAATAIAAMAYPAWVTLSALQAPLPAKIISLLLFALLAPPAAWKLQCALVEAKPSVSSDFRYVSAVVSSASCASIAALFALIV